MKTVVAGVQASESVDFLILKRGLRLVGYGEQGLGAIGM
jgi:hypothetical protein